jgi:hypothetical protein
MTTQEIIQDMRNTAEILMNQANALEAGTDSLFDALQTVELVSGDEYSSLPRLSRRIVNEWRDQGATWVTVGESLNVSRQAAQQRFGK